MKRFPTSLGSSSQDYYSMMNTRAYLEKSDVEDGGVRVDKIEDEELHRQRILVLRFLLVVLPVIKFDSDALEDVVENHNTNEIENSCRNGGDDGS